MKSPAALERSRRAARLVAVLLLLALAALALRRGWNSVEPDAAEAAPAAEVNAPVAHTPPPALQPALAAPPPIADAAAYAELHSWRTNVHDDLRIVAGLVENYASSLASTDATATPPLGANEDFVRALSGANPLGVVFLPRDHPSIDAAGRLRDRWGTPYVFHPLAAGVVELRSAGPDKQFFTADDAVRTPPRGGSTPE